MTVRYGKAGRMLAAAAVLAATAGCGPRISNHGYVAEPGALAKVEAGVHDRRAVADMLGTPSATAQFGGETWFYIGVAREEFAFHRPEVVGQTVTAIAFDDAGTVRAVAGFGLDDAVAIEPVARTTPTYGRQLGLLEQLFGNLGRVGGQGGAAPGP